MTLPAPITPEQPSPRGITMDELVEREGDALFDKTDDSTPDDRRADGPRQEPRRDDAFDEDDFSPEDTALDALREAGILPPKKTSQDDDGSQDDGDQQADTQGVSSDLQSLARSLGVDPTAFVAGDDGVLRIRTKVDGRIEDKPLQDILKGYQLQEHNTRQGMELARQRQEWEQHRAQQEQQIVQRLQFAQQMTSMDKQAVEERYSRLDWDRLRQENPGQYSALVTDYLREMSEVEQRAGRITQEITEITQRRNQEMAQQRKAFLEHQKEQFLNKMNWTTEKAAAEVKAMRDYLLDSERGFRPEELKNLVDHRQGEIVWKAMQFDRIRASAQRKAKATAGSQKPPREVPGAVAGSQGRNPSRQSKLKRAKQNLAKTGGLQDAANVFYLMDD